MAHRVGARCRIEGGMAPRQRVFGGGHRRGRLGVVAPQQVVERVGNPILDRPSLEVLDHRQVAQFSGASVAKQLSHSDRDGGRIHDRPRFRLEPRILVALRECASVPGVSDVGVHALGVRPVRVLHGARQTIDLLLDFSVGVSALEHLSIRGGKGWPEDLGQPTPRKAPAVFQLPHAVLGNRIARIVKRHDPRRRADVGHTKGVALDRWGRRAGEDDERKTPHAPSLAKAAARE